MRRSSLILAFATLTAACGSTPPTIDPLTPPAPPPPPPVSSTPASIAIVAGDGQQADPGTAVTTRPVIAVKDAVGHAVAGVVVGFAVDSGGGSVQSGSVTTAADGTASPGDWRLGSSEGRNVLRVTVGSLPPTRLSATAAYVPTTVGSWSIGTGGGMLTVSRPGSPIDGLMVQIPSDALTQSAAIAVNVRSSAGVSFTESTGNLRAQPAAGTGWIGPNAAISPAFRTAGAPVAPLLPLITLQVTGPQSAAAPILITVPLPAGTSGDVMVAVLDSANKPITFLTVIAATPTSISVSLQAFDWHAYAAANAAGPPASPSASQQYTVTLAVFPVPRSAGATQLNQVMNYDIQIPFTLTRHNFEFLDYATSVAQHTSSGMTLAEYGAFYLYPNGIYNRTERATSVPVSNNRGLMLIGGLSRDFFTAIGQYGPAWIASYYNANPQQYMRNMGYSIYYALMSGYPVPLVLTDGTNTRMVLVVGWVQSGSYFVVRDPSSPFTFATLTWTAAGMYPYADPTNTSVYYRIPYYTRGELVMLWPKIYAGVAQYYNTNAAEPYADTWPAEKYSSWDPIRPGANKWNGVDSLFILGDTTRLWYSKQNGHVAYAAPYPIPGGHNPETASIYEWTGTSWTYNAAVSGPSMAIDVRTAGQGGRSYAKSYGINVFEYEPFGQSWLYFHRVDVVKYAVDITMTPTLTKSADFTVSQPGGPALPLDARYVWDFGDGTPVAVRSTKSTFTHTFPTPGPYSVTLKIYHATDDNVVLAQKSVSYPPVTVAISPATLLASPGNSKTLTATIQGVAPAGARYRWIYGDGTKWDTTSAPTTVHTYATIGTYAIYMQLLDADSVLAAAVPAQALVKVYPAAWRITSFTLKSFQTITGGAPAPWGPGMTAVEAFLAQVVQTPSDGMIFLEDNVLFNEHAVYFQVAPPGTGASAIYYVNNSFFTLLARDPSVQFSHYTSTGGMKSGAIDGEGYTSNVFSASSYVVEDNSIVAQKNGTTMTGTITIGPYAFGGARTYDFVATLVTP